MSLFKKINIISAVMVCCVTPSFARTSVPQSPSEITASHFKAAPGYLKTGELPDSLALLPAPPAKGSAAKEADEEARQQTIPLRGGARWKQAKTDADLVFPQPAKNFSCAMGIDINEKTTPHLYKLMQRVMTDAGLSTYGAKDKYNRIRPFVEHNEGTCTPEQESFLRKDGSYPSGHSAAGWAWALVLSEVNPAQADAVLRRGLSFGKSRVICNAHWQSDVEQGRIMGAATVGVLHANKAFQSDLTAARNEVQHALAAGSKPAADCAAENKILLTE